MSDRLDPVTLEIIRNTLPAIANEMAADLQRTSYNMMIYEVCDFCTALIDAKGRLLSQNMGGVSHFVADLGVIIQDGVARYGLEGFAPGDVIITNHQRVAGQHLNNMVIYVPIFFGGVVRAFSMTRAHWIDVGGQSTGFGATARVTDPWLEGLQLDQLKIYQGGVLDTTLHRVISDNIRFPESSLGDLRAQMAACKLAARRFEELLEKYGCDVVMASIEAIFAETEVMCRKVVSQIPDGEYCAESIYDDDIITDQPIRLHAKVTVSGSDMSIDLSGCSGQTLGGLNARTYAAARIAYKALTDPQAPVNEGSFQALEAIIPEGNIMMASYPAPMGAWSLVLATVVDTILRALATVIPDRIPAAHYGMAGGGVIFYGKRPGSGSKFLVQSIEGGGWGGHCDRDGESGSVSICQGNVRNSPIESIELKNPVIVEHRKLRTDSGGPGEFRGGLGVDVRIRNLVPGRWNLSRPRRQKCPPWGIAGGLDGGKPDFLVKLPNESEFQSVDAVGHAVPIDAETIIRTGGGGGWGDPFKREPELVVADVARGAVSIASARKDYGVVIDPKRMALDPVATAALRNRTTEPAHRELELGTVS